MKTIRAILSGILVWTLGVAAFAVSGIMPLMMNPELQANLMLAVLLIPFAWIGAVIYYKKGDQTHGLKVGVMMVFIAIVLDALITVPLMIIPKGGSYLAFFANPFFGMIAFEYLAVIVFYWYWKVKPTSISIK